MAIFWCMILACTCNFALSIWSYPNSTYIATYVLNSLNPSNTAINCSRKLCYGKISFIVLVPGNGPDPGGRNRVPLTLPCWKTKSIYLKGRIWRLTHSLFCFITDIKSQLQKYLLYGFIQHWMPIRFGFDESQIIQNPHQEVAI